MLLLQYISLFPSEYVLAYADAFLTLFIRHITETDNDDDDTESETERCEVSHRSVAGKARWLRKIFTIDLARFGLRFISVLASS
jgi:hypothetical protein